jgi:tetratricopeptide (TPR) repeat protein
MNDYIASAASQGLKGTGQLGLAFYGLIGCRYGTALDSLESAERVFTAIGYDFGLAGALWLEAWVRCLIGDYSGSRACLGASFEAARRAHRFSPWYILITEIIRGRIDLGEGRVEAAQARLDAIDTTLPQVAADDPIYVRLSEYEASLYRAEVHLANGEIDDAIELAEGIRLPEIPAMASAYGIFYNYPTERDILARAHVARGDLEVAIEEYEQLVTFDPASRDRRLIFPLFHFRLGRLYESVGKTANAIREYEKFLHICGDVEPILAEVVVARQRLTALEVD